MVTPRNARFRKWDLFPVSVRRRTSDGKARCVLQRETSMNRARWTGRKYLGPGLYALRAEWQGQGDPKLEWRIRGGVPLPLPDGSLFRVAPSHQGLLASFYNNKNWEGTPLFQQITPFLMFAWTDA